MSSKMNTKSIMFPRRPSERSTLMKDTDDREVTQRTQISEDIQCKITLDEIVRDNNLKGSVQIVSNTTLVIHHGVVEISGTASCDFLSENGKKAKGNEDFYFARHTLCGGEMAHYHKQEGSYPFNCFWPTRLPGTWIGDHGSIKYRGKVVLRLSETLYTHEEDILIVSKRDLRLEQHLLFEQKQTVTRTFTILSDQGKVKLSVWVPISGICAGQALPVLCDITNTSKMPFGGLLFVLSRIDIYTSLKPAVAVKMVRTDICRVTRMINVSRGTFTYFAVLHTTKSDLPTNQFYTCTCCQMIYEVWVSLQGAFPRYTIHGYPNIDTPGIPIIVGTEPIADYDVGEITENILNTLAEMRPKLPMEELPAIEEVKQILETEELMDDVTIANLERQLKSNEATVSSSQMVLPIETLVK